MGQGVLAPPNWQWTDFPLDPFPLIPAPLIACPRPAWDDGFLMSMAMAVPDPSSALLERAVAVRRSAMALGQCSDGQRQAAVLAMADALEALIGAVYLDAGYPAAQALVRRLFKDVQVNPQMQAASKDPKTELQEWLQGRKLQLPLYTVVATRGAAHKQMFEVACDIREMGLSQLGLGTSRRAGEQAAAAAMLETLKTKAS
jgi:dsRNA-specific ribonuclease